ncbi:MAG TPA: hypothetical protein VMI92_00835 [Steroidobacteraceae bacterium]|nr:hypothetical protein [Steroidobacteraceae bacterium]
MRATLAALVLPALLLAGCGQRAATAAAPGCDRTCLYAALDGYLAALRAHDPGKVRWSAHPRHTENNVALKPGDGLWATITALAPYEMRFADPQQGEVAIFGVVEESTTKSPYALRLKVVDGGIAEAEAIVVRKDDSGIPFVTADIEPRPVWNAMLSPAARTPRAQMIAAANGYFDTLQRNDGTLHVQFTDDCNRREDGKQSTNLTEPDLDPLWKLGCAAQFRMGQYLYDDRVRDRRFMVVDEERGIVLAGGFIDHEGRIGDFKLTDGSTRTSIFRRPHSFVFLEAFRVNAAKIQQVESVFTTVPYNMPSVWQP